MKKTHLFFANLLIFIVYGFAIALSYWLFWPYDPLEIESPVQVLTPVVSPGEVVYVEFDFIKNTTVKPDITVSLVDGVIFNLPEFSPINPTGEINNKKVGILTVPKTVPCGQYHIKFSAKYQMNTFRTITVEYETDRFEIKSDLCADGP